VRKNIVIKIIEIVAVSAILGVLGTAIIVNSDKIVPTID
jgi:hypothetical protein